MESSSSSTQTHHQNPNSATNPNPQNHQPYYYPPNPNLAIDHQIQPPGSEPYCPPVAQYPTNQYPQSVDGSWVPPFSYYHVPNAIEANAIQSATNLAVNSLTQGVAMGSYPINPPQNVTAPKMAKKPKVVQSVRCEICNIECNTKDVLEVHNSGKKHTKILLKLAGAASNVPAPTPTPVSAPIVIPVPTPASAPLAPPSTTESLMIGPQENPNASSTTSAKKKRKKGGETHEDLATKTRKVLEGGAAVEEVRTCPVCNVVCNSDTVYKFHLAGQKHATMMRKNAVLTGGSAVA